LLLLNLGLLIGVVPINKNAIRMLAPGFWFIGLLFWDLHYHQKIVVILLWQESPWKFLGSKKWIQQTLFVLNGHTQNQLVTIK